MSVVTKTNRATNPQVAVAATGYAAIAGTGGTASGARVAGAGYPNNSSGYFRTSWTVATTAVSGGGQYTQTGLLANTTYSHILWVRSSKAQTVRLTAQYQTSAAANVGSAVAGANVALVANTWTPVQVLGPTSGAAVDRVVLQVQATTGGSNWANGDWFDIGGVRIHQHIVDKTNGVTNGALAVDATGWSFTGSGASRAAGGGGGIARPTITIVRTASSVGVASHTTRFPVTPGEVISYSALGSVGTAGNNLTLDVEYYSAATGGTFITYAPRQLLGTAAAPETTVTAVNTPTRFGKSGAVVPAGATHAQLRVYRDSGTDGTTWATDFLLEKSATQGAYFDGSTVSTDPTKQYLWTGAANASTSVLADALEVAYFDGTYTNAASTMYAWTGTAHASTSTATVYTPVVSLVALPLFDPTPRVEVTIADMSPTTNVVTLWRTADGKRKAVRGFRKKEVVSAAFVLDYEVPLGRQVSYEIEVLTGIMAQAAVTPVFTQVNSACGVIQDPLNPRSSVPVYGEKSGTQTYLRDKALKDLEYSIDQTLSSIMGSPDPVAIMGQRMAASGVDMSLSTRAAQTAADMRTLLQQASLVLVRPLPSWAGALPGLCYMAVGAPREQPIDEAWGGTLIHWEIVGNLVAAPTMNVVIPLWTYGDVKALWNTYQQKQTAMSGKTYLEDSKKPTG